MKNILKILPIILLASSPKAMMGEECSSCEEAYKTVKAVEMFVEAHRAEEYEKKGPSILPVSRFSYECVVNQNHPCPMGKVKYDLLPREAQALAEAILNNKLDIGPKPTIRKKSDA